MTTMPHPTEEVIERFRRGELPPPEIARLGFHLANCAQCAAIAARSIDVTRTAAMLRDDFGEHLHGEEIVAYVDGSASKEEAARAAEHLAWCEACRSDVADLRAFAPRTGAQKPSWRTFAAVAAAAVLAIAIAAFVVLRRQPAAPPRPAVVVDRQRLERDAVVAAALRDGITRPPVLAALALPGQSMRGVASAEAPQVIEPIGVVVDDTRPLFRWSGTGGARINLSVFSEGRLVLQSATLHGNEWKPAQALERGRVYRWQIEVTTKTSVMIAPGPSAPPALFAVLSDDEHRKLDGVRARFANDDLYLGVLAARNGLQGEAIDHLRSYCAAHPTEKEPGALLRAVEGWRATK